MLTETELKLLKQLAKGNQDIKNIANAISKSIKQVYRISLDLEKKGFILRERSKILPSRTTHTNLMMQLLQEYPNIIPIITNSG